MYKCTLSIIVWLNHFMTVFSEWKWCAQNIKYARLIHLKTVQITRATRKIVGIETVHDCVRSWHFMLEPSCLTPSLPEPSSLPVTTQTSFYPHSNVIIVILQSALSSSFPHAVFLKYRNGRQNTFTHFNLLHQMISFYLLQEKFYEVEVSININARYIMSRACPEFCSNSPAPTQWLGFRLRENIFRRRRKNEAQLQVNNVCAKKIIFFDMLCQ